MKQRRIFRTKDVISSQLRSTVETYYPIGNIRTVSVLEGGYWNKLFHLKSENRDIVLRLSHPTTTLEGIAYEHALMRFMSQHIPEVPAPLVAHDGSTYFCHEGRIVTLFPFMPGSMAGRGDEVTCLNAARMLARLHKAGLAYPDPSPRVGYSPLYRLDWNSNRLWQWVEVEALLSGSVENFIRVTSYSDEDGQTSVSQLLARRAQIVQEKKVFQEWLAHLSASGRPLLFGPIHGDYYPHNLLVEGEQIRAVLDWDECQPDWLVYELARATWEFCRNKTRHTLDQARAFAFLQAYQDAGGPVPPHDFDLLLPLMRCVRLIEVLFALEQARRGQPWDATYTLHNLISLENLQYVSAFGTLPVGMENSGKRSESF